MAMDCMEISKTFCVPAVYSPVLANVAGGIRIDPKTEKPFIVKPADEERLGLRLTTGWEDVVFVGAASPHKGPHERKIGTMPLYYGWMCFALYDCDITFTLGWRGDPPFDQMRWNRSGVRIRALRRDAFFRALRDVKLAEYGGVKQIPLIDFWPGEEGLTVSNPPQER